MSSSFSLTLNLLWTIDEYGPHILCAAYEKHTEQEYEVFSKFDVPSFEWFNMSFEMNKFNKLDHSPWS